MSTLIVPTQFPTIQQAVDVANPYDKIEILEGTYIENVVITTSALYLEASIGVLLNGTSLSGVGVEILSDEVTLDGFRIMGYQTGIRFEGHCNTIKECRVISNNLYGIQFEGNENSIINCTIGGQGISGISMEGNENLIENCTIDSNELAGITFIAGGGYYNRIRNNNISSTIVGISVFNNEACRNTIECNIIRLVEFGISVFGPCNIVEDNTILESSRIAIVINSDHNIVESNWIEMAMDGLSVKGDDTIVAKNQITKCKISGIALIGDCNEILSNLLIKNIIGITDIGSHNCLKDNQYIENERQHVSA